MSLGRYIIFALVLFIVGLTALYSGVSRAPFRQAPPMNQPAKQHGQAPSDRMAAGASFCLLDVLVPGTDRKGGHVIGA